MKTKEENQQSKEVLAICLKTYPDESDMESYCTGEIEELSNIKIYHKGKKYYVNPKHYNKRYYKIVDEDSKRKG